MYEAEGRNIWSIRYADDTTLLANSREALMDMAEELRKASLDFGLKINSAKNRSDEDQWTWANAT